jgi:glycosyltransferase involved in cell wall biosynthesis
MSLEAKNESTGPVAAAPSAGDKPVNSVAVIYGRINHLTLGSVIAIAKNYVDNVLVLQKEYDPRAQSIAVSMGARVFEQSSAGDLAKACLASPDASGGNGFVVLLYGDGSHDPYRIPALFEQLKHGCDVAINSGSGEIGHLNEGVLFLNNKKLEHKSYGFMACKSGYFERSVCDRPMSSMIDVSRKVMDYAHGNNLKIKYLDDESFELLSLSRIGVVVPAYNEERLIGETLRGIPDYVTRIYVIDDCSKDGTPEAIKKVNDRRVRVVRHEVNKGVGAAIITGYKLALEDDMDVVAVMAGDNQMDPAELPRLILPIIEGKADYTKGNRLISREFRTGMSRWRTVGNSVLTMITKIGSGYWSIMDPQNGYTAISYQALNAINLDSVYTYYGYCNDLLIKLNAFGMRTMDVIMPARYGTERSHIKYSKYIMKVSPMIFRGFLWRLKTKYIVLNFHPLVFFYLASMLMVPFGALFSLYILIQKILHHQVSDNYPLLAAFITLMGVQLLLFAMLFDMQEDKSRSG